MKTVVIVHGWDGNPNDAWKPWIKQELGDRGVMVIAPQFPGGEYPKLSEWLSVLSDAVGTPTEEFILIGHSLGCIAILQYLNTLSVDVHVGGCVFLAGFAHPLDIRQLDHYFAPKIDYTKLRSMVSDFVIIQSDSDPYVSMECADELQRLLGGRIIVEHAKGHLSDADGIKELPSLLTAIVQMF